SSASGGVRNPLPSWTVSPFSATADSRLVKMTSPFSSPWITRTAVGAVARISDRIIDCPVKVIVIAFAVPFDCARTATPIAHRIATRSAKHAVPRNRPIFNIVAIWVLISFMGETDGITLSSGIGNYKWHRADQPILIRANLSWPYNTSRQKSGRRGETYAQIRVPCGARCGDVGNGSFVGAFSGARTSVGFRRSHIRNVEDGPDQIRE